jgi:hypothetical protein
MKHFAAFTLIVIAFAGAGCNSDSNPLFPIRDTIWVFDSNGSFRVAPLKGIVFLYNDCERASAAGVTVTFTATGETAITDSDGNFEFSPRRMIEYIGPILLSVNKPGYYGDSTTTYNYDGKRAAFYSGLYLRRHYDYSAEFIGAPVIEHSTMVVGRDTTYVDSNGVWVRGYLYSDTVVHRYTFPSIALNERNEKTSLAKVRLLVSKSPNIDPMDIRTCVLTTGDDIGYPFKPGFTNRDLERVGIRFGDKFYVAVSSVGACSSNYVNGLRRSNVIEMTAI